MFEFSGKLTGKALKYALKREKFPGIVASLIVGLIISAIIILISVHIDLIYLIALGMPLAIFVISFFAEPSEKLYDKILPLRIYCEEEKALVSEGLEFIVSGDLSEVKEVVDFGEFYYIRFFSAFKSRKFICQKELLSKGTIDEFEQFFSDRMVRKVK